MTTANHFAQATQPDRVRGGVYRTVGAQMKTKPVKPSSKRMPSPAVADAPHIARLMQRYLGALGLLADCSVYVPEDIREMIEQAFEDACAASPGLKYRRVLDRLEIEAEL